MTAAIKERIVKFSNGVLNKQDYCVEKYLFLNQEKTRRISVGKTIVENDPMLYVIAQIKDGENWYTDQIYFARKATDVVNTLKRIWR